MTGRSNSAFRLAIGQVVMRQLARTERTMRAQLVANPADENLRRDYREFAKEKNEKELQEIPVGCRELSDRIEI